MERQIDAFPYDWLQGIYWAFTMGSGYTCYTGYTMAYMVEKHNRQNIYFPELIFWGGARENKQGK